MLNIGVGEGYLEQRLRAKGCAVFSLAPSEAAIKRLQKEFGMAEAAKIGSSQNIPFADDKFDVVVMSEVLEHLENGILAQALAEVYRVLKTGRAFIGTIPARENVEEQMVVCPECGHHFHRWGHVQSFDMPGLRVLLGKSFKIERMYERAFTSHYEARGLKRWRLATARHIMFKLEIAFMRRMATSFSLLESNFSLYIVLICALRR